MPEATLDRILIPDAPAISGLIFRRFRGPSDFPAMMRVLLASEHADGNERTVTLEEMTNLYSHLARSDPATDMLLAKIDGQLIAYGRVETWKNDEGEQIPDFPVPEGLEVRPVLPEHYRAIYEDCGFRPIKRSTSYRKPL